MTDVTTATWMSENRHSQTRFSILFAQENMFYIFQRSKFSLDTCIFANRSCVIV